MVENLVIPNWLLLAIFIASFLLFFWGIYKSIKTKEVVYALSFVPLIALLTLMFIL
jgi:hypothetical protein